jgi:hypothetical protein
MVAPPNDYFEPKTDHFGGQDCGRKRGASLAACGRPLGPPLAGGFAALVADLNRFDSTSTPTP